MNNLHKKIEMILGGFKVDSSKKWVYQGNKFYTYEWSNMDKNKTLTIQKMINGKYIVELYNGVGRTLQFNKFLSKETNLNIAKNIANKFMR